MLLYWLEFDHEANQSFAFLDATTDSGFRHVLLILFSGWDTANSLEALRGTEFSGLEVCPCRDEYEDCMAPQYQDPPLHEKIAMGSIFGDMTFSATFTLKKGSDKKKFSGKLYNLQCRHGFQSPKAPLSKFDVYAISKFLADLLLQKSIRLFSNPVLLSSSLRCGTMRSQPTMYIINTVQLFMPC